jgi:hypothetical protein
MGVVQRREWNAVANGFNHLLRHQLRPAEPFSSVDNPVSHSADVPFVAYQRRLGRRQQVQALRDGRLVIQDFSHFNGWPLAFNPEVDKSLAGPDLFDDTFGQKLVLIGGNSLCAGFNQLEFHRGTAAVQNEHFHEINR